MKNKKDLFYIYLIISIVCGFVVNIIVGSIAKYGVKGFSFKYFLKVFPFSNNPVAIFAFFALPSILFISFYSDYINRKNFKHKGEEFGGAKKGTLNEIQPFIEKDSYWLDNISVSESVFNLFIKDKNKIKEAWTNELNKQYELKNPKYISNDKSFNSWFKNYARYESNPFGTSNNMILSKDLKIGYGKARTLNKNVVVIGGAGTGKTRNLIKPNIMQMNTSFVITDPKGTILQEIGTMLYMHGYDIKIFNLLDVENSMKYNPFNYVYDELDIITLTNTLIENTQGEGEKADFWVKAEKLLYQALFGYVKKHLPPSQQNFGFIVEMLSAMDVVEDEPDYKNAIDIIFEELEQEYENELRNNPKTRKPFELSAYQDFKLAAGKTLKSILISCAARLQSFNIPQIANLVEEDELEIVKRDSNFDLVSCYGDHKTALFCITSDSDSSLNFLVAMLYTQLFNTLMNVALKDYGGSLPVHIKCLLDEFANIGRIPKFEEIIAVIRSRNISTMLVLQAKSQLKKIYKESADTIIGNCDTEIFLGGKEESTLKEIVQSLGKETIDYQNDSKSYSKNDSQSISNQKTGRDLITIDELKTMPLDECIVQIRGLNPFVKVKKYDITTHPKYKYHVNSDDINNQLLFKESKFVKSQRIKNKKLNELTYKKDVSMWREHFIKHNVKLISFDDIKLNEMEIGN